MDPQTILNELATENQPIKGFVVQKTLDRLERMIAFYESKIETAEEKQQFYFKSLISALTESHECIKAYQSLCKKLQEAAE